jgi:hypothetical protein
VVSHNNAVYVANTIKQFSRYGITPIVIDNASNRETLQLLAHIERSGTARIVYAKKNWGHKVGFLKTLYDKLPNTFAYTDPDLQLNMNLPSNFLNILESVTERYRVYKAGFALDLLEGREIISVANAKNGDVRLWESQFWRKPLIHDTLEVWAADIDTTFAVYSKKFDLGRFFDSVRVGGAFAAIHMPWFPEIDLFTELQRTTYLKENNSSSWVKLS